MTMHVALPEAVAAAPRLRMGLLPTPLEAAPNLSRLLGGPKIYFKRDDLTGQGLGGNKVRKLEFILAAAKAEGATTIVACGGYQSNMTRITASMAARMGLECEIVLSGLPGENREPIGNLLLDRLFGAKLHFYETEERWQFGDSVERLAEDLRRAGKRPFVIPLGGSSPLGMASYIAATAELLDQMREADVRASRLYVAIGSGGTFCGLTLGALNLAAPYRVTGVSVSRRAEYLYEKMPADAAQGADFLGLAKTPGRADFDITDDYLGAGYGEMTEACAEAIRLTAQSEGVLLDPVYSGKAMAGLIDHVRSGRIGRDESIVFLNTGGWPALFAFDANRFVAAKAGAQ